MLKRSKTFDELNEGLSAAGSVSEEDRGVNGALYGSVEQVNQDLYASVDQTLSKDDAAIKESIDPDYNDLRRTIDSDIEVSSSSFSSQSVAQKRPIQFKIKEKDNTAFNEMHGASTSRENIELKALNDRHTDSDSTLSETSFNKAVIGVMSTGDQNEIKVKKTGPSLDPCETPAEEGEIALLHMTLDSQSRESLFMTDEEEDSMVSNTGKEVGVNKERTKLANLLPKPPGSDFESESDFSIASYASDGVKKENIKLNKFVPKSPGSDIESNLKQPSKSGSQQSIRLTKEKGTVGISIVVRMHHIPIL